MNRFQLVVAALVVLIALPPAGWAEDRGAAQADLVRLEADRGDNLRVHWPDLRTSPARVSGLRWTHDATSPEAVGAAFIDEFRGLTGVAPEDLSLGETEHTKHRTVLRFRQTWQGIPVLGGEVILSLDREGQVLSMASSSTRTDGLDASRDIGQDAAMRAAIERVHRTAEDHPTLATRVIVPTPGGAVLAWRVVVPTVPMVQKIVCLVDAATGEILKIKDEVIR